MAQKRGPKPSPPPGRPLPWAAARSRAAAVRSVTRDEIERFWRRKKMEEEDHLLAALKAAARIRARNLKEEDYKRFEASLGDIVVDAGGITGSADQHDRKELSRAVIRDWWPNSRYAYLNQPAVKSMEAEAAGRRSSATYIPNACFYAAVWPKPCSALGVSF